MSGGSWKRERSPCLDEVDPESKYDDRQLFISTRVARRKRVRAVDERRSEHVRQVVAVAVPRRSGRRHRLGRAVAERVEERADGGRRRRSAGSARVSPGQFDDRRHVLAVAEELDRRVSDGGTSARVRRTVPVRVVVRHHVVDLLSVKLVYVTHVRPHDAL